MFCSKCGKSIQDGAQRCESCGAPVSAGEAKEPTARPAVQKKKMPLWFKILALLAVAALVVVSWGIWFTEGIVDVVDEQLATLRTDNITKAYYAYTSVDFQKTTSLSKFKKFVDAYPIFKKIQSVHFSDVSLKDNVSTLKGTLTSSDNEKLPIEYQLIKEEGKWKILNIQLLSTVADESIDEASATKAIMALVKGQLEALKKRDIADAYEVELSVGLKDGLKLVKARLDDLPDLAFWVFGVQRKSRFFCRLGCRHNFLQVPVSVILHHQGNFALVYHTVALAQIRERARARARARKSAKFATGES